MFHRPHRFSLHRLRRSDDVQDGRRLVVLSVIFCLGMTVLAWRLFQLQVLSHGFYSAIAADQHGIIEELFPKRGAIYLTDPTSPDGRFPAAVNKTLTLIYADPRQIDDPAAAAKALAPVLGSDEAELLPKLDKPGDPYEPLKRQADEAMVTAVKASGLAGIGFADELFRHYPDKETASHLLGFVGMNDQGERVGRYGIEGYWNAQLAGEPGYLEAERDPVGRWIGTGSREFRPAADGSDIVLTVDRNIQFVACEKLKAAIIRYGAKSGAVVVMDPKTGAVKALCGDPDYDPNGYSSVSDMGVFNNPATFTPYEPGSVMKPITLAAAIDAGRIAPTTTYEDTGSVSIGPFTIKNSDGKANGIQTMTQVLEKSLNTGAIFVVRQLGPEMFRKYVSGFGFGGKSGIELDSEATGDISSLSKAGDIWSATASYGQGITVTTLQLATAFSALANGGQLMKPYVVAEVVSPDGSVIKTEPKAVRQVISKRAATLISGMLVRVVENGHGKRAGVPGYWVAGKTGTAQIPRADGKGYEENAFIGSFAGFVPVDDPVFVIVVRIDRPSEVEWAESSAAPLFGEIAAYLLQYQQIPPERPR